VEALLAEIEAPSTARSGGQLPPEPALIKPRNQSMART
jgi:hypothetical protein